MKDYEILFHFRCFSPYLLLPAFLSFPLSNMYGAVSESPNISVVFMGVFINNQMIQKIYSLSSTL